jgi:hypothetical protein
MRVIEKRYGAENVGPWDDWTWGYVHGKLAALRWVLTASVAPATGRAQGPGVLLIRHDSSGSDHVAAQR